MPHPSAYRHDGGGQWWKSRRRRTGQHTGTTAAVGGIGVVGAAPVRKTGMMAAVGGGGVSGAAPIRRTSTAAASEAVMKGMAKRRAEV